MNPVGDNTARVCVFLVVALTTLAWASNAQTVPAIITQPASQGSAVGGTIAFSVSASGAGTLAFQWQKNTTNLANGSFSGRASVSGATTAGLLLAGITTNDQANYTCLVTNHNGSITSSAASLTVYIAPAITTQPIGKTNAPGANVTFSVVATGTAPLAYQWMKNATDIPSATLDSYSLSDVSTDDTGSYTVAVSNPAGSVNSSAARLVVQTPPAIVAQPVGSTNFPGDSYTFNVSATGDALAYQWKRNGVTVAGATNASYTLANIQLAAAGTYTVIVSDLAASVTSVGAPLAVVAPLVISVQPASQIAGVGSNVTFSVTASDGSPQLFYQWFDSTNPVTSATSASLTLNNVQLTDSGGYYVVITNSYAAITSSVATLSVQYFAPNIITQPLGGNQLVGDNFTFMVTATGTALAYQWQKNGANVASAINPIFALTNLGLDDAGNYSVVITNVLGSVTSSIANLTVAYLPPVITMQPVGGSQLVGGNFTFTVVATGTPLIGYQWQKNGGNIQAANGMSLSLSNLALADAGDFRVVVTNNYASITSSVATLYVGYAPVITQQPVSTTNAFGNTTDLACGTTGPLPMTYQWFQNGTVLPSQVDTVLSLTNLQLQNVGNYQMTASNAFGSTTSLVAVLHLSPGIVSQPTSQIVMPGSATSFSVLAGGEAPLTYMWQLNGTNLTDTNFISGSASSIINLVAAVTNALGNYAVVVSNNYGSVTSTVANLSFGFASQSLFDFTGFVQPYVVPSGSTNLGILIIGANDAAYGSRAAMQAIGVLAVSPSDELLLSGGSGGGTGSHNLGGQGGNSPIQGFNGGDGGEPYGVGGGGATLIVMPDAGYIVVGGAGGGYDSASYSTLVSHMGIIGTDTAGGNGSNGGGGGGGGALGGAGGEEGMNGDAGGTFLPTNYMYGTFQWTFTNANTSDPNGSIIIVTNPIPLIIQQPLTQNASADTTVLFSVGISSPLPLTYQWSQNGLIIPNATNSGSSAKFVPRLMQS